MKKYNQLLFMNYPIWYNQLLFMNYHNHKGPVQEHKNLGQLWLAYTALQGDFNMLQLMTDDSGHFTQPELSLWWSD